MARKKECPQKAAIWEMMSVIATMTVRFFLFRILLLFCCNHYHSSGNNYNCNDCHNDYNCLATPGGCHIAEFCVHHILHFTLA